MRKMVLRCDDVTRCDHELKFMKGHQNPLGRGAGRGVFFGASM